MNPQLGIWMAVHGIALGCTAGVWAIELSNTPPPAETKAEAKASSPAAAGKTVNQLFVVGEDKFLMKSQKTAKDLTKDINEPIAALFASPLDLALNLSPAERLLEPPQDWFGELRNTHLLQPVMANRISVEPFVRLSVNLGAAKGPGAGAAVVLLDVRRQVVWQKNVSGQAGAIWVFWDGRDAQGRLLLYPGRTYIAELRAAPNPPVQLQTVQLGAMTLTQGKHRTIWVHANALFEPKGHLELLPRGRELLDETADYLRDDYAEQANLTVYAEDLDTANTQKEIVKNFVLHRLNLNPEKVQANGRVLETSSPETDYPHLVVEFDRQRE